MKLNIKRISAYALSACLVVGSIFQTGSFAFAAESNTRVHVYQIVDGQNKDIGIYDSISSALKKADGETKTVLELLDPEYEEMLEIKKANVTITSKNPNEPATLKGKTIKSGDNSTMISIRAKNVTIDSINITGLWLEEPSKNTNPVGIRIKADNATINNCKVYNMGCKYTENTVDGTGFNGHGIICSNDNFSSDETAIKNTTITKCELYGLVLGNSEALVMNGNVTGFNISDNIVHDCDNIGIDIIGYEKSNEDDGYSEYDRARNGVVKNNIVYNISSGSNLTYRKSTSKNPGKCAGGIYVDGGHTVIIEGNYVENCDIGIELASEHGGMTTDNIKVLNNVLVNNNALGGISIGGSDDENGNTTNCTIQYNTIYNTAVGCFRIQHADDEKNNISKNILIAEGKKTRTYLKEDGAGTNTIKDNIVNKSNDDYNNNDKQITVSDVHFSYKTGTISFKHEGADITGYGSDCKEAKEVTSEEVTSEQPTSEETTSEEPASEEPTSQEQPTSEEATSEEPKSEEPTSEEPISQNQPTSEEATSEESTSEEPTSEEPTSEEPTSQEQPTSEEPTSEEATSEETTSEEPASEEPTSQEQPTSEEVTSEEPTSEEPTSEELASEEPTSEEPTSEEPASEEPKTEQPTSEIKVTEEFKNNEKPASAEKPVNSGSNNAANSNNSSNTNNTDNTVNNNDNSNSTTSSQVSTSQVKEPTTEPYIVKNTFPALVKIKKNVTFVSKKTNSKFKITKITKKKGVVVGGTVEYLGPNNKKATKITVPNNVKVNGIKFKVTSIANNAVKNNKNLTTVTIGTNVTKIGANSFNGCKKLKTVTIRSTKINKIGKNAFKGIHKKAIFKLPKKQKTKYEKLINKNR